jgi:very-short-patch-repair endonuclease
MSNERLAQLHGFAREMRNVPTVPEVKLWKYLNRSQLGGFKFRRQAVIGPFIADFLCPQKALIVEVDGETHVDAGYDARRDAELGQLGFRVVRVTNAEVMANVEGVLSLVLTALQAAPDRWGNMPHPNPSPEGEGLLEADESIEKSYEGNVW